MTDTIYNIFFETAQKYPNTPAVIEDGRTISFSELSKMTDIIFSKFKDGTKSVGIVMSHRAEMAASMLAVLKFGARYIPAEPTFPKCRTLSMFREAEVSVVVTESKFKDRFKNFPIILIDENIEAGDDLNVSLPKNQDAASPAYVLYTSGTTGRPKGVCVTNANVLHYVRAFNNEFKNKPGDIMLQYSVCSFDIFVEEVFASLLNGAAIAIAKSADKKDINTLMAFIERHNITMISGFPYLLAQMNHLKSIPSSLRLLISGGDVIRGSYVDNLVKKVEIYNTYGPSETTVCASYYNCSKGKVLEDGTYPVGKAVRGTQIKILDDEGNEVEKGVTGEICIFGDGVSNGYIGNHDEENKAFVTLNDGNRMYRSGDLGYILPDGNIAFLHRKDSQIMILGKRTEISEVESRLNMCSGVKTAIVRAFLDEQNLYYMAAYVVPKDKNLKLSDLKSELAENLTDFMIPEFFVMLPEIPLNSNGKPDTERLPKVMKVG